MRRVLLPDLMLSVVLVVRFASILMVRLVLRRRREDCMMMGLEVSSRDAHGDGKPGCAILVQCSISYYR